MSAFGAKRTFSGSLSLEYLDRQRLPQADAADDARPDIQSAINQDSGMLTA